MEASSLYKHFAQSKHGQWIMIWPNAQALYKFVLSHDVKNVLDLGTGIGASAAMVALALKEKGVEHHIDTIEQYNKCIKIATDLIPKELQENMTIHKANVKVWNTPEIPHNNFSIYSSLPNKKYDLIINDGPGPFLEKDKLVDLPNGTIHKLLLEGKLKTGSFIVYDGRITSLRNLERYYGNNFFLVQMPQNPGDDFHALERKDNPVQYEDDTLENMKLAGYFDEQ